MAKSPGAPTVEPDKNGADEIKLALLNLSNYYAHAGLLLSNDLAEKSVFFGNMALTTLIAYACSVDIVKLAIARKLPGGQTLMRVAKMAHPFYMRRSPDQRIRS